MKTKNLRKIVSVAKRASAKKSEHLNNQVFAMCREFGIPFREVRAEMLSRYPLLADKVYGHV